MLAPIATTVYVSVATRELAAATAAGAAAATAAGAAAATAAGAAVTDAAATRSRSNCSNLADRQGLSTSQFLASATKSCRDLSRTACIPSRTGNLSPTGRGGVGPTCIRC